MDRAELNEFILANMPHFIAMNYQRLLETQPSQERVELIVHIYNLGLRALTIILVSQYLIRDRDRVSDSYLDELLLQKFYHLTLDAWEEILFTVLKAYEGKQDLFFMSELYDFYWDASTFPHRKRAEVKLPFDRLTQAAIEVQTKQLLPQDELNWKTLAEELMEHLQQVLRSLSFMGKYDLIRVLGQDELFYAFELYKGIHISKDRQPLPKLTKLHSGWFYLRAVGGDFLLLHPLLVFWEGELKRNELIPTDTGIFDRLVYERLRYLLAMSGQTSVDDKRVQEFVTLIYDTIAETKRKRREVEKLTWVQLCDICEDITRQRMATVRRKYRKELYLQRDKARQKFEAFLDDPERRCFVLVGKSGVGKSNFLLALGEELHQSRSDVCVLIYDGANLEVALSVTGIISQDFSDRLLLSGRQVQQVWHEIAKIDGIEERLVVLFVDTINENPRAKELLRQLDALVQGPWPWLKIVFTSRPEMWQTIKRGIKLAEALYYQEQGAETLGVDLESFSYSERMEPFSRQELPEVYIKYQQAFELQTPYEALSNELRETLRDPLNLWLVAKTYKGQTLPDSLKATMLIEQYVNALLHAEALRLLEKQLVPLMVRERHYSNVVTTADIDAAGDALYEAVYSEQVLSNGQLINLSFRHLLDADILVRREHGLEQKIAFKYERLYEYFAGRRIFGLSETQPDRYAFFLGMIEETTHSPFLWGAVRDALIQDTKEHGPEIVRRLCFTTHQRVKEMMVNVVMILGLDIPQQIEDLLKSLISPEKKATEFQKLQQLLGKSTILSDARSRNAGKIAIEVASYLKFPGILQIGALQGDPTLRTAAVRYSYHLWQRDQEAGFEIIEYLAESAIRGFLPNLTVFEPVLGLSLIIIIDHYGNKSMLVKLQGIWHKIIAKELRIREGSSRWKGVIRGFLREQIFSFVSATAFRLLHEFPDYNIITEQGLEAFFHLGTAEKALYRRLIQYIDVEGSYSKEQMENDYLAVIKINNLFLVFVEQMGLVAHACHAPVAFLPFLKKLFEEAKRDVTTYPYLADVIHAADNILDRNPMIDEVFDFFIYAIEACQECHIKHPQAIRTRGSKAPETEFLGPYILHHYQKTGTARTKWLERRIQAALSENNILFFHFLLTVELPVVGIERREPRAVLDVLTLFFHSKNVEINQMIQSFLARLRIRYPDEVDDFLEEQHAEDDFRLQVQTNEPVERVGELIGQRGLNFLHDGVIKNSPDLRSALMCIFEKAADCKNVQVWIDYFIRELINLIYGGEALRQSE